MKIADALSVGNPLIVGKYVGRDANSRTLKGNAKSGAPYHRVIFNHTIMAGYPNPQNAVQVEEVLDLQLDPNAKPRPVPQFGKDVIVLVHAKSSGKAGDYEAVVGLLDLQPLELDGAKG